MISSAQGAAKGADQTKELTIELANVRQALKAERTEHDSTKAEFEKARAEVRFVTQPRIHHEQKSDPYSCLGYAEGHFEVNIVLTMRAHVTTWK